jgi:hypothetical protein
VIELERHIEILLLSNDCVIVPELGGFMTHHIDAYYDESENLFLPPQRTLGFNAQITINDSLLAQSYVEAYDISFPEATRRIESEVHELKQQLSTEGSYELNDIGILSINTDGKFEFKPCDAGILTPSLYGLGSFLMNKIKIEKETTVQTDVFKNKEELVKPIVNTNIKKTRVANDIKEKKQEDTIVIKIGALRNTIAVAAAIISFFIFTLPLGNTSSSNRVNESSINNGIIYKILNEPSTNTANKIAETIAPTKSPTTTSSKNKEEKNLKNSSEFNAQSTQIKINKTTTDNTQPFCLVLASHVTKKNAQIFANKLHKEGYQDVRVVIKGKTVRVVYGYYDNESKAYNELNRLNNRKNFEEAWVYKIK